MTGGEHVFAEYKRLVDQETSRYDAAVARIKAALDAGEISVAQAAAERIGAMEQDLAALRRHRRELWPEEGR